MRNRSAISRSGFTLLELAVVITIITVVMGVSLSTGISVIDSARLAQTQKKMQILDQALMAYRTANDRIPCPSALTIKSGSANYGKEAANAGSCTGGTPAANYTAYGAAEGGVPTATLGLPADFMYDGWGNRFRYAVDTTMTATKAFPATPLLDSCAPIQVKDAFGNSRTTTAIYALISHGPNGHGAYTASGATVNAGSTSIDELKNCHCSSSGTYVANSYDATYVEKNPNFDSGHAGGASYYFDDIVTYKERWMMRTAWDFPSGSAAKVYYLAAAHSTSPYVTLYKLCNGTFTKFAAPATIPNSIGYSVDFSPDNSLLAWAGATNHATNVATILYNVTGSGLTGFTNLYPGSPYSGGFVRFSPDGQYLATNSVTDVSVLKKTGNTYATTGISGAYRIGYSQGAAIWSPDGTVLYQKDTGTTYYMYTHSGGAFNAPTNVNYSSAPILGSGYWEGGFDIDPTNTYLAITQQVMSASYNGPIVFQSPATPTPIDTPTSGLVGPINGAAGGDYFPMQVRWSPDGTMLAVGYYSGNIRVYSFSASASPPFSLATISRTNCSGYNNTPGIAWSSDSQYLAIGSSAGGGSLCVYKRAGTTFTNVMNPVANAGLQPGGSVYGVVWSH